MSKLRKAILIIGILVVAVAASLGTALALYATGSMKTDPIELVFTLAPEEKVYDGTPLKAETYALTSGKLVSGHRAHLELTGSQTDVGTSMSDATVKIYDENGFNVTGDYSIKVVGAKLTVTQKTISVELPSQTVVYNGSKVLFNQYRIADDSDGELCSGHKIYGSTDAELLNVGDALPEDLTPLIFDVAGRDVTSNYNIVDFKYDGIEIVKRHVSVRPVSGEKVYDGKEMLADEIEFVEGSLVEGQTAEFLINEGYLNKLTDVGDVETQVTSLRIYDFINGEEVEVTENYEIDTFETGYLKVTPRPLTITAKSASFVYNGEEQSLFDDDEALKVEGLADGEELLGVTYSGALTDVGTTENYIIGITLRGREENYEKSFVNGTIEITPYELTYETFSSEKFYDGDPLYDARSDYDKLANEKHRILINGADGVPVEPAADVLPSVTNVGQIANAYTVTVFDNVNNDCTQNYKITYDYGTLTVKKLNVKVTLKSAANAREKVNYDSREHAPTLGSDGENSAYFAVEPLLQEGEEVEKFNLGYSDFEVVAESRYMRVAGEYYYTVKFKDREYADRKLYSNYELFVPESGVLEITPLPVTVTLKEFTEDKAFVYSGKAVTLGADEAIDKITLSAGATLPDDLKLDDILTAEDFAVVAANDIINAGTDYNYSVKIADVSFAKNFAVTLSDGKNTVNGVKITVKPMPVTVTLADVERTYSGEEHSVNVDETVVKIAKTDAKEGEDDETGLTNGDLTIAYDTDEERIIVTSHKFTVAANKKKAGNYELNFKSSNAADRDYGILKINRFKVEVTTDTPDLTYNAEKQSSGLFTHGELANAKHTASRFTPVQSLPYVINVGENTENRFSVRIYDGSNKNVTDNYDIKYNYGTLSVKKCPVTITTDSDSKPYDGEALTAAAAEADKLFGHSLSLPAVTPSQTEVGSKTNEFYCDIIDGDGISVIDNYLVTYNPGTLEVTKREIVLKTDGALKTYDGTPLYKTDVTVVDTRLAQKFKAQLPVGVQPFSITEVGEAVNTFDCAIYLKDSNDDVTDNFDIVFSDECGKLKIDPLAITFLLHDFAGELEYDGKPKTLEVDKAVLGITGGRTTYHFVEAKAGSGVEFTKDDFEIVYSSLMLDAGNYSYSVKFTDENFAKNFTVNKQTAPTVRIMKKSVEILLKSYTGDDAVTFAGKVYKLRTEDVISNILDVDGSELLGDLLDKSDFNVVYKTELLNAGRHEYTVAFVDDVFAKNFFFSEPKGYVDINKFDVKISLGNFSADYSGKEFVFPDSTVKVITDDSATDEEKALAARLSSADFTFEAEDGKAIIKADTYTYGANLSDESKAQNFNVETVPEEGRTAKVTVKKVTVTVTLKPQELTFDGNELQIDPADALEFEGTKLLTVNDFSFRFTQKGAPATLKKSGEYDYEAVLDNDNFTVTGNSSKITVKKCTVTVTLNNLSKTYDGKEFDVPTRTAIYSVDGDIFGIYDFEVKYVESGEHVNFGEYHLKAELLAKHNDIKDDVVIVTENGLITITKRAVTVKTQSKTFVFNGSEQSAADEPELSGAVEGDYAVAIEDTVVKVIDITDEPVSNATEYEIYRKKGGTEVNVTENYEISYIKGELQVKQIDVKVTLASDIKKSYLGVELSLDADDVIDEIKCDAFLSGEDFEVVFYETVRNAGKYAFELKIKEDSNPDVYNLKVEGQKILTVEKLRLNVELESYTGTDAREYTGKAQKLTYDALTVGDNPDDLTAEDFRFDYTEDMKDVGTYEYGVKFADEEKAANYDLQFEKGYYQIIPAKVFVTLKNYEKIYQGTAYTVDIYDAIESIKDEYGEDSGLLSRSDFEVKYLQELRLANGIVKPVEEGEAYDGKTVEIDGVEYKVITDDSYSYSVELTKRTESGNFEITVEGGSYVIKKRKLTFTLSTFYISKIDFEEGFGGDYEAYGFEVSANVGLSSTTSLAQGDELHINSALAQGEGNGFIALYLLDDYTLTNADCYEFTNLNGTSAVYAKLEVFDV